MILNFTISNFRSIKDPQTLSFEATDDTRLERFFVVKKGPYRVLKMLSVLGANASGKSNLLRAFSLFQSLMLSPCASKQSIIDYRRFALSDSSADGDSTMVVNFIVGERRYRYEVTFNPRWVSYELLQCQPFDAPRLRKVFERELNLTTMVSTIKWGENYRSLTNTRLLSSNLLHNRTLFGSFQFCNIDIPWLKQIVDWVGTYFLPAVSPSEQYLADYTSQLIDSHTINKDVVMDFIRIADLGVADFILDKNEIELSPNVADLLLKNRRLSPMAKNRLKQDQTMENINVKMIHHGESGDVQFDFFDESAGTQRYYGLAGVISRLIKDSHFVAIDELENKLHPDLYRHFITTFLTNASESQMIHTTHIREFLDDRDTYRDDTVWFTEKKGDGSTDLYSLAYFGSDVLRRSTNRLNAYRAGRLGAIPRLGETYLNFE